MKPDLLITNARVITWEQPNRILTGYTIGIAGERIAALKPQGELEAQFPSVNIEDAGGKIVMPGNICAHTHFYGAFARGMPIPGAAPGNFLEILKKLWWPLDLALDEEAVYLSAMVCLIDAIRHGTTTLIDHHASPNAIMGSLNLIAHAVAETGLRAVLCYEVTDRNGPQGAMQGIQENLRFIERTRRERVAGGRVAATFGLHASLTLSDATLQACREAAPEGTGFHIHVAEAQADQTDCLLKSGLRVVERLHRFQLLGPDSICVHAVHLSQREIELLAETGAWVTHQPRSNMNNAVGIGAVEEMLRAGVRVCLGNDGFSNAMWEEWKTAYLVHKAWQHDPRCMPADQIVRMAVYHSAALANRFFPQGAVGAIKEGAFADLIFVNYHPYTPLIAENLPWHIVFGFHESMVTDTMVAGKFLMKDRRLLTVDETAIAQRAQALAPEIWRRYRNHVDKYANF